MIADVEVIDECTVVVFHLKTEAARSWVEENMNVPSCWQISANRFGVDRREARHTIAVMEGGGLMLEMVS
jgi:hypothetical protein